MVKSVIYPMFLILVLSAVQGVSQNLYDTSSPLWKAQKDEVYLQEVSLKIPSTRPVTSVAGMDGRWFAVMDEKIYMLSEETFVPVVASPVQVKKLEAAGGKFWALTSTGAFVYENENWKKVSDLQFLDICIHNGKVHAATREEIWRYEDGGFVTTKPEGGYYSSDVTMVMEDGTQIHADPVELGPIHRIESYSGTLYVLRPGELVLFDGRMVNEDFIDWGTLPSRETRDLLSAGSRLFVATGKGLAVLRGAALSVWSGKDGLPVENTTCLAHGFDGDIWIGTQRGAVRMTGKEWHYFGADLWLPDNHVNDIGVDGKTVCIATNGGLAVIRYEPFTLLKKSAFYEKHLNEWGHKRLGFIHTIYKKNGEWVREVSDNDGGHTATYLAAMCYKYAVTGDEAARKEAVESFMAMLWLERIVPVEGFFARSIWSATADRDERGRQGSGGLPAKWYPTPDGKWFWKGDTSSDEVTAHFYAVSLFYELAAKGREKELAREHLERIASYILKCGWTLHDMDGKPTRWGRWNPEYLLRPYGYVDRGVNGLEALAFMKTVYSLTEDKKFLDGYNQLINWGYHTLTIRQKNVFPPETIAPWDDNLAFESYYTLMRYADDPALRSVYLRSLERTWEVKRMEHIPWFNFAYGAITGNDCDEEQSVKHLREWILDPVEYNYSNSHRDDLFVEPGYTSYEGGKKAVSPREMAVSRGSRRAVVLDGGMNGNRIMEPTGFIRDYWMGRYHGFIKAPETNDPALISVDPAMQPGKGAAPYNGPERPVIK